MGRGLNEWNRSWTCQPWKKKPSHRCDNSDRKLQLRNEQTTHVLVTTTIANNSKANSTMLLTVITKYCINALASANLVQPLISSWSIARIQSIVLSPHQMVSKIDGTEHTQLQQKRKHKYTSNVLCMWYIRTTKELNVTDSNFSMVFASNWIAILSPVLCILCGDKRV